MKFILKFIITLIISYIISATAFSGGLDYLIFDVSKFTGEQRDYTLNVGTDTIGQQYIYMVSFEHRYHWLRKGQSEFFWQSALTGKGTSSQFRYIGWHTMIGMKMQDIEFFYDHLSEHLLDTGYQQPYQPHRTRNHYPLMNRIGIRWTMFKGR